MIFSSTIGISMKWIRLSILALLTVGVVILSSALGDRAFATPQGMLCWPEAMHPMLNPALVLTIAQPT
jgi:hypothetical protein